MFNNGVMNFMTICSFKVNISSLTFQLSLSFLEGIKMDLEMTRRLARGSKHLGNPVNRRGKSMTALFTQIHENIRKSIPGGWIQNSL